MDLDLKQDVLKKFKELYFFEFRRKDSINSNSNFLLALFTIYGSILVYYFNSLPKFEIAFSKISFFLLLTISLIFLGISVFHLTYFLSGRDYQYVSDPEKIRNYLNEVSEFNDNIGEEEGLDLEEEFYDLLLDQITESVTINSKANRNKITSYNSTSRNLYISLLLLTLTSIPFFVNKYQNTEPVQKVEITNYNNQDHVRRGKTEKTKTPGARIDQRKKTGENQKEEKQK